MTGEYGGYEFDCDYFQKILDQPALADYFYSRFSSVYGGSEEIQLDTIGERLLDLPRDPAKTVRRPTHG